MPSRHALLQGWHLCVEEFFRGIAARGTTAPDPARERPQPPGLVPNWGITPSNGTFPSFFPYDDIYSAISCCFYGYDHAISITIIT